MNDVIQQEKELCFHDFNHEKAFLFGMAVLDIVKKENLKNVRIRVTYNNDIIFQYLMNGKTSETWLDRKEKTVLESKHSSLYVFYNQDNYSHMVNDDNYAVCGGGFPLIVNNEVKGTFIISGLSHEEDHQLIIDALRKIYKGGIL